MDIRPFVIAVPDEQPAELKDSPSGDTLAHSVCC